MKVTLRYYGLLAEFFQTESEERQVTARTVGELRTELQQAHWFLETTPYKVAKGTILCTDQVSVEDGDELVLLPPFAGG